MAYHRDPSWYPFFSTSTPWDLPITVHRKHAYADDLAIMHADGDWQAVEEVLSKDMATIGEYIQTWKLKITKREPSPNTVPRNNVGQVAQVSSTHRVTSQKADITRRTLGTAYWLGLRCWANNAANSHLGPGSFGSRVLRSCLLLQCSYLPHCPCQHQRRLANCDWLPASCTSRQSSDPRRHPTFWASSQRSHTVSSTPCHGTWTSAPLSAHLSTVWECTAPQIDTPIYTRGRTNHQFIDNNSIRATHWADHWRNAEWLDNPTRLRTFIPNIGTHPPGMTFPRTTWVRLFPPPHQCRTFPHLLVQNYKWDRTSSVVCESFPEEQTIDHVVLHCPNPSTPHWVHGLTFLDDETIEWLLNTCSEIYCRALDKNSLKRWRKS